MKKIIQFLLIVILLAIIGLIIVAIFNPMGSRDKLVSSMINSYLSANISGYEPLPDNAPTFEQSGYNHPLLNDTQEKTLYDLGVDTSKLPTEISDEMKACFVEKLGQERANELVNGASPTNTEVYKARECLGK
ncbi:hypothetical protein C0580_02245 [Candidatus Parcubacteria bacterium]|nr:MAG: hypothetical protein C0580_02245 [Candidatus Parcubacteria bacterium]